VYFLTVKASVADPDPLGSASIDRIRNFGCGSGSGTGSGSGSASDLINFFNVEKYCE
jgi:hypothetical protein